MVRRSSMGIGRYLGSPLMKSIEAAVKSTAGVQKALRMLPPSVMAFQVRLSRALRVCGPISRAIMASEAGVGARCPQIDWEAAKKSGVIPREIVEESGHGEED